MNPLTKKAYAKINLGLDVIRKRSDGYHEVSMIMQTVSLYDTLTMERAKDNEIHVKVNLPYLPTDHRNIVYKAAELFLDTQQIKCGVRINIQKRIPVAAGLAGGSSDAAATLKGLNELFQTGLSLDQLKELGVKLGADVPYCLQMGTALSEGIGELLTKLPPMPECEILLVKPDINVSTRYVYENLRLDASIHHPDIPAMVKAIEKGSLNELIPHMDNILQTVTIRDYPVITEIKEKMRELGALTALMSGSGPTVFGIFKDTMAAKKALRYFEYGSYGKQVFLTKPYWP